MIVIEKNEGRKIAYEVSQTKLCFDDDLTINLAKRQKDEPEHIDICYDHDGALMIGASLGWAYVAQIDIPAKEYEAAGEDMIRIPLPLDMDKVTLTLWAVE